MLIRTLSDKELLNHINNSELLLRSPVIVELAKRLQAKTDEVEEISNYVLSEQETKKSSECPVCQAKITVLYDLEEGTVKVT